MKQTARTLLLLPLLILMILGGMLAHPSSASAASNFSATSHAAVHFFWKKGYAQPNSGGGGNLLYHGGPVMEGTTKAYAIFWEPKGTFVGEGYNKLLKRYFNDVGDSPLYENNQQYTDATGKAPEDANLANTWLDTSPYPAQPLFDADIQNEVAHAIAVNGWTPSINHIFFVFLSLNEFLCFAKVGPDCSAPLGNFCAYHSAFGLNGDPAIYAAMPYDGNDLSPIDGCYGLSSSPNHNAAADAEISTTSHEQIEAATDPLLNGWFDSTGLSGEIGDKCAYVYGPLKADGSNVSWDGHHYIVQSEWDNAASGCVLKGP